MAKKKQDKKTPDLRIKSGNNKAPAVETKKPDNFVALKYIDELMQKAPGTRAEHIAAQHAIQQVGTELQRLTQLAAAQHELIQIEATVGTQKDKIEKQNTEIGKLKEKIKQINKQLKGK